MNTQRKNPLKVRKQRLIERINKCKKISEIEGFERTFAYHDILKDNQEWDYSFFFDLIEFKLKRMSEYFHTHHIVVDEEQYARQCNKAIAILNAGYKTNIILSKDLTNYVNKRNWKRFIPKYYNNYMLNPEKLDYYNTYGLAMIREYKAKALFWKYLYHYIERWWD